MGWYEDRVFPHLLDWATRPLTPQRQELIGSAQGRVLELGVGTGANLAWYGEDATEIHGIEPGEPLLDIARQQASQCAHPDRFHFHQCGAEALPFPDKHFDTVIACLVMCTIPDAESAAREIHRVLKPDGKLLVLEHVRHARSVPASLQSLIQPVWKPLACGCHLNRDTGRTLAHAGLDVSGLSYWQHPALPKFAGFMLSGSATRG